jgi:hypothetical protein
MKMMMRRESGRAEASTRKMAPDSVRELPPMMLMPESGRAEVPMRRMMATDSGRAPPPFDASAASSHQAPALDRKWSDRLGMHASRFASGVKRAFGIGRPSLTIMNAAAAAAAAAPPLPASAGVGGGASLADLGLQLQRSALGLFGEFVKTAEDGVSLVDYDAMKSSEAFASYTQLTALLRGAAMPSPAAIGSRDEQLAFWLNLYAPPPPSPPLPLFLLCRPSHFDSV